jgi:hypothetical protein
MRTRKISTFITTESILEFKKLYNINDNADIKLS